MSMQSTAAAKVALGGHSYIQDLGNDPRPPFEAQCELVTACLDSGIPLFDTTYYQERVALGRVLRELGRRDEAEIAAWNFFRRPGRAADLVPSTPYEPAHLDIVLGELQTDRVDVLVIHAHDDVPRLGEELALARRWMDEDRVGRTALGMVEPRHLRSLPRDHPIDLIFAPFNAFNRAALPVFEEASRRGMAAVAMSPFVRGWKLDEIGGDTASVADILLRWVASQNVVDRVIVSMRRVEWVRTNLASIERGPLNGEEQARLAGWVARLT